MMHGTTNIKNNIRLFNFAQNLARFSQFLFYCKIRIAKNYKIPKTIICSEVRGGVFGWGTELKAGRSSVGFPMLSLEFFIDWIIPAVLSPCGRHIL